MELLLIVFATGLLVFVGVFAAAGALWGRPDRVGKFLAEPKPAPAASAPPLETYLSKGADLVRPLGQMLPRSPQEISRLEQRLWQAGIRRKDGPALLYGSKILLALILFVLFLLTGQLQAQPFLYAVLPVLLGALLPDLWLKRRIGRRQERIQLALPDALDLTVVCVEAGLGLDQSLLRISDEIENSHPELADELKVFNLEVRAGRSRTEALRNLARRTGVDDVGALVTVLIQSDRFGTSIAQSLRVFSDTFRTKRRQRAEERAAKMTIKMIPALVFFILPALVVVLGPAIIAAIREVLPGLTGG